MTLALRYAREETLWQQLDPALDATTLSPDALNQRVLSLPQWQALQQSNTAKPQAQENTLLGVWVASSEAVEDLKASLDKLATIWLHVPRFNDGRHFSSATLLRRMGFAGELRAFGDVLVDQLLSMQRVGYDIAVLRDDQHMDDAQAALKRFSDFYQGDVQQPLPAYRRGRVA